MTNVIPAKAGIHVALAIGLATATLAAQEKPELLYVCIQDEARIAVVDMKAQRVLRTIDLTTLGFPATAKPHHIAVEPSGANWYVSLIGANRVLKFDANDKVVAQFEMETPGMLSIRANSDFLAVSRSMSAVNPPSRIAVVRKSNMQGEELDVLFPRPHPVIIAGNGYAYTASLGVNQIASIRLADDRVELTQLPGATHSLVQFALSPDGNTLVASTEVSGQLLVFSLANAAKPGLVRSISLGTMAFDPAFSPDGRFVYVPVKSRNEVAVIETSAWTVIARITHPSILQPQQVVFSADGSTAFVTNNNRMDHMADPAMAGHVMPTSDKGSLVVIDTRTRGVVKAIELGKNLTGMNTRART